MKARKFISLTVASLVAMVIVAAPAAAVDGSTTVTLATVNTLTILPTSAASLVTSGGTASGDLGLTSVVDPTGQNLTVDLTGGTFTSVDGANTIAVDNVDTCVSAGPTEVTLTGAAFNSVVDCATPTGLSTATPTATLFTVTGSGALTEFTFTPNITVDVSAAAAGIYTGTVTQSAY